MHFTIEITDLEGVETILGMAPRFHPDHLISITSKGRDVVGLHRFRGNRLVLKFNDTIWPSALTNGECSPRPEHVKQIVEFGRGIEGGHLLVHCHAGISRSTAAALIVLATHKDPSCAKEIDQMVRRARPSPTPRPNNLMLEYADELLGWDGCLAELGGWHQVHEKFVYGLPLFREVK